MGKSFLFAAYALVWIIFMIYAWNISRRQAQLRKDLEELKRRQQSTAKG
jgi:CcmD family protein